MQSKQRRAHTHLRDTSHVSFREFSLTPWPADARERGREREGERGGERERGREGEGERETLFKNDQQVCRPSRGAHTLTPTHTYIQPQILIPT